MKRMWFKRVLSSSFIFLLLSSVFITAFAIQPGEDSIPVDTDLTREAALELATTAFPEYASKIRGEQHLTPYGVALLQSTNIPELVYIETRQLSEYESVTYQEYSNGIVLSSIAIGANKHVTNTSESGGFTYITMDMALICSASTVSMLIQNIQFNYRSGVYSMITNQGTSYYTSPPATVSAYHQTGTASIPAYLEYAAQMQIPSAWGDNILLQPFAYLLLVSTPEGFSVSGSWTSYAG